jgi:SAM-dependent methyltransferase
MRLCDPEFKDDAFYLESAESEANRLATHFGCGRHTRVLDIGCGQGRLATGIIRVIGDIDYIGIDVDKESIDWCRRYIERHHKSFHFHRLDVANERYNPRGVPLSDGFQFKLAPTSVDIVYLYAVFSNMTEHDMRIYLKDCARILADGRDVFFTAYVEDDVPDISINPDGYIYESCVGPLHVVRYNRLHLFTILSELGYRVEKFTHRSEADGQSAIYLRRVNSTPRDRQIDH